MLEARNLSVGYDGLQVVWDVSITVADGEVVALLGPNGSGKSTVMNSLSRLVPLIAGEIWFDGVPVHTLPPHRMIGIGVSHVLERHRLFPYMSVLENLQLGCGPRAPRHAVAEGVERAYALFPRLKERQGQMAASLSGGEQQMCALARGLMSRPKLLLVDEPFIGLSPHLRGEVAAALRRINGDGVALLLIEQNVRDALAMSHRTYVLREGRLALEGDSARLRGGTAVEDVFLARVATGGRGAVHDRAP
jgi:branched-chain amino acid transport system ATP-binding protein